MYSITGSKLTNHILHENPKIYIYFSFNERKNNKKNKKTNKKKKKKH